MNVLRHCLLAFALLTTALPAAADDAFYFVGRVAPEGSLSAQGQGRDAVYLRWGPVEGTLPAEVTHFVLMRDGSQIARMPAHGVMAPSEINALYIGEAQQRRFLESAWQLQRMAVEDPEAANFPLSEFPIRLAQRLNEDAVYRALAARTDFNIARATYRGFLDTQAVGTVSYELLAENAAGELVRAGYIENFDTTSRQQLLAPGQFDQVFQGACDELEAGRDEQTIALTWSAPGAANAADSLASRLFIAGYDLYRGTEDLPDGLSDPPLRDLASEAASLPHDNQGRVVFPGLEAVNDVLLTIDGAQAGEAVFLETHNEIARAGIEPGDRRAYYLVPRDFAGQYGPTLAADVTVPDRARPPEPWDIREFADPGEDDPAFELSWDAVNPSNFLDNRLGGNQICNPREAEQTGIYELVPAHQSCAEDVRRRLRLDVSEYRVYRFENFIAARDFRDTDGDGLDDDVERQAIADGVLDIDQCVAQDPATLPAYLQDEVRLATEATLSAERLPSGREIVRMRDKVPVRRDPITGEDLRGEVFWYRIASVTPDGRVSRLSATVRGIFPERDAPTAPEVTIERRSVDAADCDCGIEVFDAQRPWRLHDRIGSDNKIAWACNGGDFTEALFSAADERSDVLCRDPAVQSACGSGNPSQLRYQLERADDKEGQPARFCTVDLPADTSFCQQGAVAIERKDCAFVPLLPGEPNDEEARITAEFPPGSCGSIFRTIAGKQVKIATSCGTDTPELLQVGPIRGTFCGAASSQDDSNDQSPLTPIPCFKAGPSTVESAAEVLLPPPPPQLLGLDFVGDNARVRWRLPAEPLPATVIELRRRGGPDTAALLTRSVPTLGTAPQQTLRELVELPEISHNGEEWCVRIRAITSAEDPGRASASAWTPPLCAPRGDDLALPEYLPWPQIDEAPRGDDLRVINGLSLNAPAEYEKSLALIPLALLNGDALASCEFKPTQGQLAVPGGALVEPVCPPLAEAEVVAALAEQWSFSVYRQSRQPDGAMTGWRQVSPLIDRIHWERAPGQRGPDVHQLADPYLKLYASDATETQWVVAYADLQPRFIGREYRYQIVYFSADRRIRNWRQTNWLDFDSSTTVITPPSTGTDAPDLTPSDVSGGPDSYPLFATAAFDRDKVETMVSMEAHVSWVSQDLESDNAPDNDVLQSLRQAGYSVVGNALITSNETSEDGALFFEGRLRSYVAVRGDDLVITFRGSGAQESGIQTAFNTLTDFNIRVTNPSFFPSAQGLSVREQGARIHRGFDNAYMQLRDRIRAAVAQHPDKNVYVFGHSLGGALATLCALDLALNPVFDPAVSSMRSLTHMVSGSPRVGDQVFREVFERQVLNNLRIAVQNDRIPMIPTQTVVGSFPSYERVRFVHVGRLIHIGMDGVLIKAEDIETRIIKGKLDPQHKNTTYLEAVRKLRELAGSEDFFNGRSELPQQLADAERAKTR